MKKHFYLLALLSLVYCSKESKTNSEISKKDSVVVVKSDSLNGKEINTEAGNLTKEETVKTLNDEILSTLKSKDYVKLSNSIHPEKGIRFSMYGYIQPKRDKLLTKEEFIKYIPTNIKFTWAEKDGTGDKLVLSLKDYLNTWVYVKDFTKSDYSENSIKAVGNSINNMKDIYPNSTFTENYLDGSEEYGGMDWNSLRFVFEELNGIYYLVAVINDQWTT